MTESTRVHEATESLLATEDSAFGGVPAGGVKPYAGTSGRGGSEASAAQRALEDANGTTGARQNAVLSALENAGALGLTWRELANKEGWHHGQATGALSTLHKANLINRLFAKRGKSSVYVLPKYLEGRAYASHGGRTVAGALAMTGDEIRLVESFIERTAANPSDKPFAISNASAKGLAAILKRALTDVR